MTYMRQNTYQYLSQSQIGILQSIVYLPSMITPIIAAPIIEKLNWFNTGVICQLIFVISTIIMQFVYESFPALLISRLIFGLANEATWLVQSTLITENLEQKYQPMAFGVCMSISTGAQLIGFFVIPVIFSQDNLSYQQQVNLTFGFNIIMAGLCFIIFSLLGICILKFNKQKIFQLNKTQKEQKIKFTFKFKLQMLFCNSYYVYIQSILFGILLSSCYGCQTQILSYLLGNNYSETRTNINGVIRSVMAVIGGPLFGFLTTKFNRRIIIIGFILLLIEQIPPEISMVILGLCDGGSPCTSKQIINNLSPMYQRINAMAICGCIFNIFLTIFPYLSGLMSSINLFRNMDGIVLFYILMLLIGSCLSIYMEFVNRKRFDNKMNLQCSQ